MWADIELHARIARAASNAVLERLLDSIAGMGIASRRRTGAAGAGARAERARPSRDRGGDRGARRGGGQRGDAAPSGERRTGGDGMIERPGKIVAIGLNYMDHVRESGMEPPAKPLVFAKFTTSLIGDERGDPDPARADRARGLGGRARGGRSTSGPQRLRGRRARPTSAATRSPTTSPRATCSSPTSSGCAAKSLDTFCPLGSGARPGRRPAEPQAARHASTARSCRTPTRRR